MVARSISKQHACSTMRNRSSLKGLPKQMLALETPPALGSAFVRKHASVHTRARLYVPNGGVENPWPLSDVCYVAYHL